MTEKRKRTEKPRASVKPRTKHHRAARKAFQKAQRGVVVAKMYAADKTQREIATTLGVNQSTVSGDIGDAYQRYLDKATDLIVVKRKEQIERLEQLRLKYMEAWERSKGLLGSTRQERREIPLLRRGSSAAVTPSAAPSSVFITNTFADKTEQNGDPRFLNGILAIEQELAKLQGLYAPTKATETDLGAEVPATSSRPAKNLIVIRVGGRNGDGG